MLSGEQVVILSTTLSNPERLNAEHDASVDFLSNPRRFNVALTRAKALCVIVGNPCRTFTSRALSGLCMCRDYHMRWYHMQ